MGGEFYDLAGPKSDLAFCPLRDIDDDSDLTWAVGWIEALCELNGLDVHTAASERRRGSGHAAPALAHANPDRTQSANVQDIEIRDALQHFTVMGPLGSLLDAEFD